MSLKMEGRPLVCAAFAGAAAAAAGVLAVQALLPKVRKRRQSQGYENGQKARRFVGIDIGGTTLTVGLVDDKGKILGQVLSEDIGTDRAADSITNRLADMVRTVVRSAHYTLRDVAGVGVCSPGLLDYEAGIVKAAANLPWKNVPLNDMLAQALDIERWRVVLENDGNTALLAELWIGAAKGKKDVVLLTLGTGIGAGIICGGHLLRGCKGEAGELGHMILMPGGRPSTSTGVNGIFENYASASSVVRRTAEGPVPPGGHVGVGGVPATSSLHGLSSQALSCAEVFKQAAAGDAYAQGVVRDTAKFIAIGSINCARCYDPELILFTGGMAGAGEQLLQQVREQFALPEHHWNIAPVTIDFRIADAPAHAGLIGAAYAACRYLDVKASVQSFPMIALAQPLGVRLR